jgi:hypothetical protein
MKKPMKVITWTLLLTTVLALPFILRRRMESQNRRSENIRYDINDYLAELEA